ncbi:MAG: helix-turn-helix domain-containing protein [Ruminococcaceae bacterium]|nr:helix-turn-helix domain-containing protein [Oscillospiraceae bacterium]
MVSVFNFEQLQSLLQDFHRISNIRITVFDHNLTELVSYPEQRAPLCQIVRGTEEGMLACAACDRNACAAASKQSGTYIYRCHAGLTEAVIPLYVGNALVGYLLFGHVFAYKSFEEGWDAIQQCCKNYPIDKEKLRKSIYGSPCVSDEYILSAAKILHATASYLVLERMATLKEDSSASKLNRYLNENYTHPLTAQDICAALDIGRTQLYKLSAQLYGCGITQQIKKLRMERAKQLLTDSPNMSIADIACACGYCDYNYFIAVFSQFVGQSPNAFRKKGR